MCFLRDFHAALLSEKGYAEKRNVRVESQMQLCIIRVEWLTFMIHISIQTASRKIYQVRFEYKDEKFMFYKL
jgi:hypothetical protein